jgi:segregation and condensation protein B
MNELEKLIEAALFMTAKPLTVYDLIKATKAEFKDIKSAIKNLQNEYIQRDSWIEIVSTGKTYFMRLKPQYADRISSFVQETELSKKALRVLAIVANNDGILQSKVVRSIGPTAYDGVKELEEKGFIKSEKKGHSKILHLSQKFKTYFGEIAVGDIQHENVATTEMLENKEVEDEEANENMENTNQNSQSNQST